MEGASDEVYINCCIEIDETDEQKIDEGSDLTYK